MWVLLSLLASAIIWGLPVLALIVALRERNRIRELEARLAALEKGSGATAAASEAPPVVPPRVAAAPVTIPEPTLVPSLPPAPTLRPPTPATRPPEPLPAPAALSSAAPIASQVVTPAPVSESRARDMARVEEWVGSVWLQNAGSVILLLGVFFLILWGYSTGLLGGGVLVAAGVALGGAIVWRGDGVVATLPRFGYALVGIGIGTAYLTLCLGYFHLHVLGRGAALALLAATSTAGILLGMRYRAQYFAIVGVIGAHVPPLLGILLPGTGFTFPPLELLGYLAAVNWIVYVLAWRSAWSALTLTALILTTATWGVCAVEPGWSWLEQIGLSLLYLGLGLAPLPGLARREAKLDVLELAVVATAPLALLLASWPFLEDASRGLVATWSAALFGTYVAASVWLERRRPGHDLWRIVTAAATLYLTVALQRALGDRATPIAWLLEGFLLVYYGFRSESGWLRFLGYAVGGFAFLVLLGEALSIEAMGRDVIPFVSFSGIRELVCAGLLLLGGHLLARVRERLARREQQLSEVWTALGNFIVALWVGREAGHVAYALEDGRSLAFSHAAEPSAAARAVNSRISSLTAVLMGLGWMLHANVLVPLGLERASGFLRFMGHVIGGLASLVLLFSVLGQGTWTPDRWPIVHPTGIWSLAALLTCTLLTARLRSSRSSLADLERRAPEAWAAAASLLWMSWTAREAGHVAVAVTPGSNPALVATLAAAFTSAAWLVQSVALMAIGWFRDSAFLRWSGLVLLGVTVLKFLFYDLRTVDSFWRFLTAALVGAALLAISYAYQRRQRRRAAQEVEPLA